MTYEEIKQKVTDNKPKIVLGVCFVLVFIVGFGAGSFDKELQKAKLKSQANYTTKAATNQANLATPVQAPAEGGAAVAAPAVPVVKGASTSANCLIKGNISSSGRKLYHVPGGAFYKIVKPEQCFKTEAEAVAAGFVKSGR